MDVLFWSELLVVQVSISIERPASTQNVRPMIGRPADVNHANHTGWIYIGYRANELFFNCIDLVAEKRRKRVS